MGNQENNPQQPSSPDTEEIKIRPIITKDFWLTTDNVKIKPGKDEEE